MASRTPARPSARLPASNVAPLPPVLRRLEQTLTTGNLWLSVLSLAAKRKIYAYNLPEEIRRSFHFLPSRLLVYLVLYRLEGEGMLTSAEDGRRRYYSLTSKGKAALANGKALLRKRANEL